MTAVMEKAAKASATGIELIDVGMTFERDKTKVTALDGLKFTVRPGAFCAVLGPSGCGKSTLMSLAAGLARPSRGRVLVDGRELDKAFDDVGIVFQSDVLLPWLTILDNLLLPARIRKLDLEGAREAAHRLLKQVGLETFADHYPSELSGGMRQRASICRALLPSPSLLLMDEPFGALDALTREKMQRDLNRMWAEASKTVLFITHDIEEAVLLADQIIVMSPRPGRVLKEYAVDFAQPRDAHIRRQDAFQEIVDDIRTVFQEAGVL